MLLSPILIGFEQFYFIILIYFTLSFIIISILLANIFKNIFKFLRNLSLFTRVVHRQTDNPISCKVESYVDSLLVHEMHAIPCFVKIVRTVLEIEEKCVHEQTDKPSIPLFTRLRPI